MSEIKIRTRMAPSPTGDMHVGSMATLLKNYAFAKGRQGKFVLRIEDTDRERLAPNGVEEILQIIKAYGLGWDEGPGVEGEFGPYIQSERLETYQDYAQKLIDEGKAYYCFCSRERLVQLREEARAEKRPPKYDQHCLHLSAEEIKTKLKNSEPYVIRLKVPIDKEIIFTDLIRGEIKFNSNEIDDQVLLKSDGFPTYHLAVVVDDHLMEISHIMRGEEWISSTPKHVLLYQAFSWVPPVYAHIPVFLNPDGKGKMSKRKGTVSAKSFLAQGYLPEALLNFFMILGWTPKDQREIISLEEYIQEFDPQNLSKNSVVFDLKKLDWINGVYIRKTSLDELRPKLEKFLPADFPMDKLAQIWQLICERLVKLDEIEELTSFFYRDFDLDTNLLLAKADSNLLKFELEQTITSLEQLSDWRLESLEKSLRALQEKHDWHRGQYFMTLRVAITGRKVSPPLFETMTVFDKTKLICRLKEALRQC